MKYLKIFGLDRMRFNRAVDVLNHAGMEFSNSIPRSSYGGMGMVSNSKDLGLPQIAFTVINSSSGTRIGASLLRLGSLCGDRDVTELTFGFRWRPSLYRGGVNYPFLGLYTANITGSTSNTLPTIYIPPFTAQLVNTGPAAGYYEFTFTVYPQNTNTPGKLEIFLDKRLLSTQALPAAEWNSATLKTRYLGFGAQTSSLPAFTGTTTNDGAIDDAVFFLSDMYAHCDDALADGSTRLGNVTVVRLPAAADSDIPFTAYSASGVTAPDKVGVLNTNLLGPTQYPTLATDGVTLPVQLKLDVSSLTDASKILAVSGEAYGMTLSGQSSDIKVNWKYGDIVGPVTTARLIQWPAWATPSSVAPDSIREMPDGTAITKEKLTTLEWVVTPSPI